MAAGLLAELHRPSHIDSLEFMLTSLAALHLTSEMKTDYLETLGQLSQEGPTREDVLVPSPALRNVKVLTRTSKGFHSKDGQNV